MAELGTNVLRLEGDLAVEGFDVGYSLAVVENDEPPLLLLGGAFQTSRSWEPFRKRFGDRKSMLSVALPGAPENGVLPRDYDCRWLGRCVIEVLDRFELVQVDLLAFSYATPVALCVAAQAPDRLRRLALGGTAEGFGNPDTPSHTVIKALVECLERGDLHYFVSLTVGSALCNMNPSLRIPKHAAVRRLLWRQLENLSPLDIEAFIENSWRVLSVHSYIMDMDKPQCLTLGFTGEHDFFTAPEGCESLVSQFPDSLFTTIRNTDHLFAFEDQRTTVDLIETFFFDEVPRQLEACTPFQWSSPKREAASTKARAAVPSTNFGS